MIAWYYILIIAVVLAVAGFLVYWFVFRKPDFTQLLNYQTLLPYDQKRWEVIIEKDGWKKVQSWVEKLPGWWKEAGNTRPLVNFYNPNVPQAVDNYLWWYTVAKSDDAIKADMKAWATAEPKRWISYSDCDQTCPTFTPDPLDLAGEWKNVDTTKPNITIAPREGNNTHIIFPDGGGSGIVTYFNGPKLTLGNNQALHYSDGNMFVLNVFDSGYTVFDQYQK